MDFSVVIPVYGCPLALKELCKRLTQVLTQITNKYEIILVNDGCPLGSWDYIKKICKNDKNIIGVNLSKNFGQVHATNAGLNLAKGDFICVMDCDLQDPPEAITPMYKKILEGFDVVYARRVGRKDKFLTKFLSKSFYKVYNFITGNNYDSTIGNLNIVRKKVLENYKKMKEKNKSYAVVLPSMGFRQTSIDINPEKRKEGTSSYTFTKKIKLATSLITSQSNKPLLLSIKVGFISSFFAFVYLIVQIIQYFTNGEVLSGWTSTIVSIYFIGGLILSSIGLAGIYIGNIFEEIKGRPSYMIQEILNKKDENN